MVSANFFTFGSLVFEPVTVTILRPVIIIFLTAFALDACGQKQLLVLKRENVLLRLYAGDEFIYREKGSRAVKTTYVNNLSDTAIVTHRDTVPFHTIERIYFRQHKFYNTIGAALVIFGSGLFLIDQINTVVVQGQSPSLDDNVSALSLGSLSAGLPLMLIKKRSQKIRYPTRLMVVEQGSAFYRPDTRETISNE